MGEREQHQYDGDRIQCGQYRHGDLDDRAQSGVGDDEAEHGEDDLPRAVARRSSRDGAESGVEIGGAGADQPGAHVEAGYDEHDTEERGAEGAEQGRGEVGEHGRARVLCRVDGADGAGYRSHIAQRSIDHDEQNAGAKTGVCGLLLHLDLVIDVLGADVRGDHDAEVQRGEQIHGLVAVEEASRHLIGEVVAHRFGRRADAVYQACDEQDGDQHQQQRSHEASKHLGEFLGMLGEQEGQCEEHARVDELREPAVGSRHERRHHHLE